MFFIFLLMISAVSTSIMDDFENIHSLSGSPPSHHHEHPIHHDDSHHDYFGYQSHDHHQHIVERHDNANYAVNFQHPLHGSEFFPSPEHRGL